MNSPVDYAGWQYPDEYDSIRVREYLPGSATPKVRADLSLETPEDALMLPAGRYRIELCKAGKPVRGGSRNLNIGSEPQGEAAQHAAIYRSALETATTGYTVTLRFVEGIVKSFPKSLDAMSKAVNDSAEAAAIARQETAELRGKLSASEAEVARLQAVQSADTTGKGLAAVERLLDIVATGGATPEKVAEVLAAMPQDKRKDALVNLYASMSPTVRVQVTVLFLSLAITEDKEELTALLEANPEAMKSAISFIMSDD